ncbi:MAG: hypothetical protein ACI9AT_000474 [Ulvibacter sp.]|jgi:hypothetical protein
MKDYKAIFIIILLFPTIFWSCDNNKSSSFKENTVLAINQKINVESDNRILDDTKLEKEPQLHFQNFENDSIPKNKIEESFEYLNPNCPACETLSSINFFDRESNELVNEFNVIENNPYYNFDLPVLKISEGIKYYDLKKSSDWVVLERYAANLNDAEKAEVTTTINYSKVYKFEHNKYVVVAYVFGLVSDGFKSEELEIFGSTLVTTYIILNNNGEIITTANDLPGVGDDVLITTDGHYLTYIYSENENGFRIHDLNNNKLLLDYPMQVAGSVFSPDNDLIFFGGSRGSGNQKAYKNAYFAPSKQVVYINDFDVAPSISDIKNGEILYTEKDGSRKKILLEDFKQKIKL